MWAFWNADAFVALTPSKTSRDNGIKLGLPLQLSDAEAVVLLMFVGVSWPYWKPRAKGLSIEMALYYSLVTALKAAS